MRIVTAFGFVLCLTGQAFGFEFLVQERGPAAVKLKTELSVAVTAESLGDIVKAIIVQTDDPDTSVAVAIYLSERVPRLSIAKIGTAVRKATPSYERSLVSFYLADQRNALWASAHSAPKLKVNIIGLDREQYLVARQGVAKSKLNSGDRVVAEAIMTGADGGAAQIIRNKRKYYFRQYDRDSDESTDTAIERERGRYWIKCCSGRRYLVTKTAIEVYNDSGFVRSGRRLK